MDNDKTVNGAGESSPAPDGSAIRFRLLALYHNCHSGAAFARCDAVMTDDHAQKRVHRQEAVVYETCASWIKGALDTLPNVNRDPRFTRRPRRVKRSGPRSGSR